MPQQPQKGFGVFFPKSLVVNGKKAWWAFRIFFFLRFRGGEREEESEARGGGLFYSEIQRGGGYPTRGGGVVHTGAERVSRGGGGA